MLWHGFIADISRRKHHEAVLAEQARQLQASNADLEQFAYAVSHDMRQPLRMVSSYLQLLERSLSGRLQDDEQEFLAFALDGARRMDSMIVSLLEYSRVGRKTSPKQLLSTRETLDEALAFCSLILFKLLPALPYRVSGHRLLSVAMKWCGYFKI